MRRVIRVVKSDGTRQIDSVILNPEQRRLQTAHLTGVNGTLIGLMLPEPVTVRMGDAFELDGGDLVEIVVEPEPLSEIRGSDVTHLARLAWHLGDRHVPIQVLERRLRLKRDPAIEALLQSLGAKVVAIEAPFEPEGGAYAAPAGDHHHHDHHHGHGHDHHHHDHHDHDDHHHGHDHSHDHKRG